MAEITSPYPFPAEGRLAKYTLNRVSDTFLFAKSMLSRRDISPRSERFWGIFKDILNERLETSSPTEVIETSAQIRTCELLIEQNAMLKPNLNPNISSLQNQILQLRQLQYFARYSDYMSVITSRIRSAASKDESSRQFLGGDKKWTEISKNLEIENDIMKKGNNENSGKIETQTAVRLACSNLAIGIEAGIATIHLYAKRNDLFHSNIEEMKRSGNHSTLAAALYNDYQDVEMVFSPSLGKENLEYTKDMILDEINWCFDTRIGFDNPGTWFPTAELKELIFRAKEERNQPFKAEMKATNVAKSLQQQEEKQAKQKAASLNAPGTKKRMASTAEPRGDERYAKAKRRAKYEDLFKAEIRLTSQLRAVRDRHEEMKENGEFDPAEL
ncbi:MAG: hypothetical protein M1829_005362 [Trizodia sp. TS-e1964]|nr:MAG: hypothetical protein M1829_005362 [Trizodia sp. TS-e1964]